MFNSSNSKDELLKIRVNLTEGNYFVQAIINNNKNNEDNVTVKAQGRRVMAVKSVSKILDNVEFTVNIANNELSIDFYGNQSLIKDIAIKKVDDVKVIYIAGDSTVCDQENEPFIGWGQMIPCFFTSNIAIANYAYSGRSSKSFIEEGRLDDIINRIREGDYLFIQFGHNDQKEDSRHTEPYSTYKEMLRVYIDKARVKGAIPVLITPMHRRFFNENGKIINTLGQYPDAMRQLAKEENVFLIDLNEKSERLFNYYGPDGTKKLFIYASPGEYSDYPNGIEDNTHFSEFGAYEIARIVAEEIKNKIVPLGNYIRGE